MKACLRETGPVRLVRVEQAQREIIDRVRKLEEAGEIVLVVPDTKARGMSSA